MRLTPSLVAAKEVTAGFHSLLEHEQRIAIFICSGNPCALKDRKVGWYSHYGSQYGGPSKNEEIELPSDPAILLLGDRSKGNEIGILKTYPYCYVRGNTTLYYAHACWPTIQSRGETLPLGTVWMKPGDAMLNEINQTWKDKCYMKSLLCGTPPQKWNSSRRKVEWRLPGVGSGGMGEMGRWLVKRDKVSVL